MTCRLVRGGRHSNGVLHLVHLVARQVASVVLVLRLMRELVISIVRVGSLNRPIASEGVHLILLLREELSQISSGS